MLKQSSHGGAVETLQTLLNHAGAHPHLSVDGDFGPITDHAVRDFQGKHRDWLGHPLEVDGEVGDHTWWSLHHLHGKKGGKSPPHHQSHPGGGSHTAPSGGPPSGPVGQRIVRIAQHEADRGVREHGYNTGHDVYKYQHATGLGGTGWPWCAAFVTWVYERAGLVLNNSSGFASVPLMEGWARNTGRWHPRYHGYVAPPGSIIIYTFQHTGIVAHGHASGSDSTVEGNTSSGNYGSQGNGDGVYRRTRSHAIIKGYVVMKQILKH